MTIAEINADELILESKTSAPSGIEGDIYYNSTDKKLNYYDGSQWVEM